jgi:trans-aconitate 2-methyltransferase
VADTWDSALYDDRHSFVWKKSADLVEILDPKPGDRILDLGCGTGHLTDRIAASGAAVTGIDASPSMIATARQNFPKLKFQVADARTFRFDEPFDAVFSNAALHWVLDASAAAGSMARALRPEGRLVLEMGAKENIARIRRATEAVLEESGFTARNPWFFPSLGEYASLLEAAGFEIETAQTFVRWNRLEHPERGLREWLEMFAGAYFAEVPNARREGLIAAVEAKLRPTLWREGAWWADYRRLRIKAVKLKES